jgi:predicted nucleotidyltransferase
MDPTLDLPEYLLHELDQLLMHIASDRLVKTVVLFGSTARNSRNESSDIDLLILVDTDSAVDHARISTRIRKKAFELLSLPLDLIVESHRDFQERVHLPTLERKIAREGMVLYAA